MLNVAGPGKGVLLHDYNVSGPVGEQKITILASEVRSDGTHVQELGSREIFLVVRGAKLKVVGEPGW